VSSGGDCRNYQNKEGIPWIEEGDSDSMEGLWVSGAGGRGEAALNEVRKEEGDNNNIECRKRKDDSRQQRRNRLPPSEEEETGQT
jgi:hypothetical protein